MKIIKFYFFIAGLTFYTITRAQQTPPPGVPSVSKIVKKEQTKNKTSSKLSITAGLGLANYFGDLLENNRYYSQAGVALSIGVSYLLGNQFSANLDVGIQKLKAADSKNKGAQYTARNLSFKSNVIDLSLSVDYYILKMKKHGFSPYFSAGIGAMFFNPYANDISGKKQYLRELGTEGQGLTGYPGQYGKTAVQIPLGFGLQIAAGKKLMIKLDFKYHFTRTDYLDDVSTNGYPPKALLDARNPVTSKFTWRGNEVGGETYPKNLTLPRGNPKDKDGYQSTVLKFVLNL